MDRAALEGRVTLEGWRELTLEAFRRHQAGDSEMVELMARILYEQDAAKHQIRELGYGCTGMPWLDMVKELPGAQWQS